MNCAANTRWGPAAAFPALMSAALLCLTGLIPPAIAAEEAAPLIQVSVDIRPGLCPNHIRLESPLAVPIAILGAIDFELDLVDPESVRLWREGVDGEVKPTGWTYEDVGTPLVGGLCACHKLTGDGLDDLEFWFSIEDIAAALELAERAGEIVPLKLSGRFTTGERIEGADCALVICGPWAHEEFGAEVGLLPDAGGGAGGSQDAAGGTGAGSGSGKHKFTYYSTVSERVTIAIYDTRGRVVARLNDMDMAPGIYSATWNGRDENREEVPPGIYFARVNNSVMSDTRKFEVSQ